MCDIDFDASPEVWRRAEKRSRVVHWCRVCGRLIHPGEMYGRVFAVWEGEAVDECACLGCSRAIEKFGSEHRAYPFPSSFMDFLNDCIIDDDEGARWKPLARSITRRKHAAQARGESRWQPTS